MAKEALISTKVEPEIKERLETAAKTERRSLSNYVALVLEQHVVALSSKSPRTGGILGQILSGESARVEPDKPTAGAHGAGRSDYVKRKHPKT